MDGAVEMAAIVSIPSKRERTSKETHFGATGHAPPETENQTRPDRQIFSAKILCENRPEPCKQSSKRDFPTKTPEKLEGA